MTLCSVSVSEHEAARKFTTIENELKSCNCIRYAAYRTASKLLVLQKSLGFSRVCLPTIRGVLEQHRFRITDNYMTLSPEEIENILHDILYASAGEEERTAVPLFVGLTKLLICDIFSKQGYGCGVTVLDLKIILVCLCSASIYSKYLYWFSQLLDHNLCLPRRRFHTLLETLLLLTNYLSESATFSPDLIQPTLDSCYSKEHHLEVGISENEYIGWLTKEPQLLVWLSTFYRLAVSQKMRHDAECSVCGVTPIVGLRYHCLRCIRYDLCQLCFFTARSSKHHKPKHIIKEYCSQATFVETASTYVKEAFKRLCGQSAKLQYLPVAKNIVYKGSRKELGPEQKHDKGSQRTSVFDRTLNNTLVKNDEENMLRSELRGIILDIGKESSNLLREDADAKQLISREVQVLENYLERMKALQAKVEREPVSRAESSVPRSGGALPSSPESDSSSSSLCLPSVSGFSTWIEEAHQDSSYTNQLWTDLDNIMSKLNNMLETNFSISE